MSNDIKRITTPSIPVEAALTEYRKKFKYISLILLIVGALGVVAYVVLGTLFETENGKEPLWVTLMLIFAVPFTLGLIGTITIIRLGRRERREGLIASCTFYNDCFFYNIHRTETELCDKFGYADAILKKETEKFCYVYILSRANFAVFSKEDLTAGEMNAIRKKFRKAVPDGEEIAELDNYKKEEPNELS